MPIPRPAGHRSGRATDEIESWIEEIVEDDGSRNTAKQIAIGGVSGWLTGFVCMKVGKVAATAIGGGIILLQIAHQKGYIKVNWNRMNKDFEKISKQIQNETLGKKKMDWTDKLEKKAKKLVDRQQSWYRSLVYTEDDRLRDMHIFITSFTAGIGLGLIMGH